MKCSILKSELVGPEYYLVQFAFLTCFPGSQGFVPWLDSEPLVLMYYREFHNMGKGRFLMRTLFRFSPQICFSLPPSFVDDFYIKQAVEKDSGTTFVACSVIHA